MSESIISIEAINYGYSKKIKVLKELSLHVPPASIYGFLGANGAGKSTTIRNVLGLLKPQSGKIQLFGKDLKDHRLDILKRVGSLIESPSIYKHLSGYDNLKVLCRYLNIPFTRIDEVLEMVNLQENSRKISRKYSTGMKQRLGLAMALLSDPDLLILDEPTSGLDPTGIIEIRNIIKRLNEQGKTIFLSSHLLSEIEKIATQVGIIKEGLMIFEGTIEELEQLRMRNLNVQIQTTDPSKAKAFLVKNYPVELLEDNSLNVTLENKEHLPKIIENLINQGIKLYGVSPQKNDLEKLFIDLTANN